MSMLQRWCGILERDRAADTPEVLRLACGEALCVAGAPLLRSLREHPALPAVTMR